MDPGLSEPLFVSLQIQFESDQVNPLAQVTLPASLLSSALSGSEHSSLSRINFMFFSSTNLFQVGSGHLTDPQRCLRTGLNNDVCCFQKEQGGRSLNSYVVASSVGNMSISDLTEPVQIELTHLSQQVEALV